MGEKLYAVNKKSVGPSVAQIILIAKCGYLLWKFLKVEKVGKPVDIQKLWA